MLHEHAITVVDKARVIAAHNFHMMVAGQTVVNLHTAVGGMKVTGPPIRTEADIMSRSCMRKAVMRSHRPVEIAGMIETASSRTTVHSTPHGRMSNGTAGAHATASGVTVRRTRRVAVDTTCGDAAAAGRCSGTSRTAGNTPDRRLTANCRSCPCRSSSMGRSRNMRDRTTTSTFLSTGQSGAENCDERTGHQAEIKIASCGGIHCVPSSFLPLWRLSYRLLNVADFVANENHFHVWVNVDLFRSGIHYPLRLA
jgi:hypothetical protein